MSTTAAIRLPVSTPEEQTPRRHLEIVPSRAQKRARPRIYAALVAVGGIVVILLAQLMMSIVLAEGAYRIADLQTDKRDLTRESNAAQESLDQLGSTQSLMANAALLGMVSSGNPAFLDVATGTALGTASAPARSHVGSGGNLVGNTLVADGATLLDPVAVSAVQSGAVQSGAVQPGAAGSDDASTTAPLLTPVAGQEGVAPGDRPSGTLPSPTTR